MLHRYHGLLTLLVLMGFACQGAQQNNSERPTVFVAIEPMAWFVQGLLSDDADVRVLVPAGQSPATFEPGPRDLAALSEGAVYVRIGVPFEENLIPRLKDSAPKLVILDPARDLDLETHCDEHEHHEVHDPHYWMDPVLTRRMAAELAVQLSAALPDLKEAVEARAKQLDERLERIHQDMTKILAPLKGSPFLVYHGAYGYLAERYGLTQLAIQLPGREAGARHMTRVVDQARKLGLKTVFIQPQYSRKEAAAVAEALGAKLVELDPLRGDYEDNLRKVAETLARELN